MRPNNPPLRSARMSSAPRIAWSPEAADPRLCSVWVEPVYLKERRLDRKAYRFLLGVRLQELLHDLGGEGWAQLLQELLRFNPARPALMPLRELPHVDAAWFLLRDVPALAHRVWGQADSRPWPQDVEESQEARRALESVDARKWVRLALPERRE